MSAQSPLELITEHVLEVDANESSASLFERCRASGLTHAAVFEGTRFAGLLRVDSSEVAGCPRIADLLRGSASPTLSAQADAEQIAETLCRTGADAAALTGEDGRYLGTVTVHEVLRALGGELRRRREEAAAARAAAERPSAEGQAEASLPEDPVAGRAAPEASRPGRAPAEPQALYRSLVESLPQNVFRKDRDGRITFANRRFCETLGRSREEVLGRTDFDLYPPELARKYRADDRRVIETGQTVETVEQHTTGDGRNLVVRAVKTPVFDSQRRVVGIQGIFWDITARRRAEEAVRESEEQYRILLENHVDGVAVLVDGKLDYVNESLCRLLGYARSELLGTLPLEILAPHDRDRAARRIRKLWSGAEAEPTQYTAQTKEGRELAIELSTRPIRYFGKPALLTVIRDVTARKRAEDLERQHREELAHVTRITTVGEMATGLAHELNQPLTGIATYAAAVLRLLRDVPEGPTRDRLTEITRRTASTAHRAAEMIGRLRKLVAKRSPQRSRFSLGEAVDDVLTLVGPVVRSETIEVSLDVPEELPEIHADMIQIEQVLLNLTRNAVDALRRAPAENRRLRIAAAEAAGGEIEVRVRDTGPGLSEQDQRRVFEQFFTTKPDGMGVGLSISRSIIESHGGRLWLEPNDEGGASARFLLPVGEDDAVGTG